MIQACDRLIVLVNCQPLIRSMRARASIRNTITVVTVTLRVSRELAAISEPATRSEPSALRIIENTVDAVNNHVNRLRLQTLQQRINATKRTNRLLRLGSDDRLRLLTRQRLKALTRIISLILKLRFRQARPRRRSFRIQVVHLRQRCLLIGRQVLNIHVCVGCWCLPIKQPDFIQCRDLVHVQRGNVHACPRHRASTVNRHQLLGCEFLRGKQTTSVKRRVSSRLSVINLRQLRIQETIKLRLRRLISNMNLRVAIRQRLKLKPKILQLRR